MSGGDLGTGLRRAQQAMRDSAEAEARQYVDEHAGARMDAWVYRGLSFEEAEHLRGREVASGLPIDSVVKHVRWAIEREAIRRERAELVGLPLERMARMLLDSRVSLAGAEAFLATLEAWVDARVAAALKRAEGR